MTHEELLAKINKRIAHYIPAGIDDQIAIALRAVMELAITAVNGNPNTAYSMGYAAACERIIQAVEKELK